VGFLPDWFDSRAYLDTAIEMMGGVSDTRPRLVALIYASLHHYIAALTRSIADARRAVELDAAFPYYALRLAQFSRGYGRILLRRGKPPRCWSGSLSHSEVAGRAARMLEAIRRVVAAGGVGCDGGAVINAARRRVGLLSSIMGSNGCVPSTALRSAVHGNGSWCGHPSDGPNSDAPRPAISVLVCSAGGAGCRRMLDVLANQSDTPANVTKSSTSIVLRICPAMLRLRMWPSRLGRMGFGSIGMLGWLAGWSWRAVNS
jgi:hypothetical protein